MNNIAGEETIKSDSPAYQRAKDLIDMFAEFTHNFNDNNEFDADVMMRNCKGCALIYVRGKLQFENVGTFWEEVKQILETF